MTNKAAISSLFSFIEDLHGARRWGSLLDAGTGVKSLEWILTLPTERWTAVTASHTMAQRTRESPGTRIRLQDRIVIGNWVNDNLLTGETFDTLLVDYLVGAIEEFAPYWQDRIFERLRPLVAPGGRMYVIGLEPYVPFKPETTAGELIWEIGRVRDACLLLAGERPYREFPMDWILRRLGQSGFRMVEARRFPIRYQARFVNSQLDMCVTRLEKFASSEVCVTMRDYVEDLRERALRTAEADSGLRHGYDYVIAAEPM